MAVPADASAGDHSHPGQRSACLSGRLSCEARSSLQDIEQRYQKIFCFISLLLPLGTRCRKPFSGKIWEEARCRAVPSVCLLSCFGYVLR